MKAFRGSRTSSRSSFSRISTGTRSGFAGPSINYWKLLMSAERYDGENDFTDDELRFDHR